MAGVYIHIPFCKQKCSYCDFHFSTTFTAYRSKMIQALVKEIETRHGYLKQQTIETIYFGGGTPSLLTNSEIKTIVEAIYKNYKVLPNIEFTLEANPDDINDEHLMDWKALGVNRLSIGLQSFLQEDLDWMNRAHSAEESTSAVKLAKNHGFSLTVDLIYGLPNRTISDWESNIDQLVQLAPDHISAYCLTVEKRTALYQLIQKGDLPEVGEDDQSDQFEFLVNKLAVAGYQQYEISNFAKEAAYSKHNSNYWKGVSYLAIGPSAHSFDGESRRWNVSNNQKYMKGVLSGTTYHEEEILTPKDRFNELLLTGLRTKWGVDLEALSFKHCPPKAFHAQLTAFKDNDLVIESEGSIYLTNKGKLQADHIAALLFIE
jgi:oxygen-independent coproporphyrinogen-3 oxidase